MNVLTILGSPRKAGNTATVLDWVETGIRDAGHSVERINLIDCKINGCLELHYGESAGGIRSTILSDTTDSINNDIDETETILQKIVAADLTLFATPLFCWGFSAQTKMIIERMCSLVTDYGTNNHVSAIENQPMALLVTAAGPINDNADLIPVMFARLVDFAKAKNAGNLIVPLCTTPDKISDEYRTQARDFAKQICSCA